MDIRNKRIQTEINRIIKESLSDGYLPTSSEVNARLSRYIHERNLDGPVYDYEKIFNNFAMDILQESVSDAYTDMSMIMGAVVDLHEELERSIDKFEVEKRKHDYRVNKLESELYNLTSQYATSGYTEVFVENIVDMENFDTYQSDCDINLISHDITLQKLEDAIYTGKFDIDVQSEDDIRTNGKISEFIQKKGSYWQCISKKESQDGAYIDIMIDFLKDVQINKVEMEIPLLKPSRVTVSTSSSLDRWIVQHEELVKNSMVANTQGSFRHMRIRIEKDEADKFILGTYEYHFLIDTILFYTINYKRKSTLLTKPIPFTSNINTISIKDEAIVPNSTEIKYYVALNSDTPQWRRISPINRPSKDGEAFAVFNTLEKGRFKDISMRKDLAKDNYRISTAMNQDILVIDEIKDIQITRGKLLKGIGQWKVDKIPSIESTNEALNKSLFVKEKANIETSYQDIIVGKLLSEEKFTSTCAVKFTSAIDCPKGIRPKAYQLSANYPTSIYLNGENIYSGTPSAGTHITYPFKEKKNILEIIINVNEMNVDDETPYALVSANLNMDISRFSTQIYGHPEEMEEVSYFNLKYNTHNRKNVYTLREIGDAYQVVIKDPDMSIKYRFYYDYISVEENELLLMIEMGREFEAVNTSPRVRKIEIMNI
jgi:hypothetical protein